MLLKMVFRANSVGKSQVIVCESHYNEKTKKTHFVLRKLLIFTEYDKKFRIKSHFSKILRWG